MIEFHERIYQIISRPGKITKQSHIKTTIGYNGKSIVTNLTELFTIQKNYTNTN